MDLQSAGDIMKRYKVAKCTHNSDGECPNGALCTNYHHAKDRRRDPVGHRYYPDACQSVYNIGTKEWLHPSNCPKGDNCFYAHSELEQYYHFQNFRTSRCHYYVAGDPDSCGWKNLCSHAHGVSQMRSPDKGGSGHDDLGRSPPTGDQKVNQTYQWNAPGNAAGGGVTPATSLPHKMGDLSLDGPKIAPQTTSAATGVPVGTALSTTASSSQAPSSVIVTLRKQLSSLNQEHDTLQQQLKAKEEHVVQNVMSYLEKKGQDKEEQRKAERAQLEAVVNQEREKAELLHQRVQCPVCFDRDRDAVVVPCGHVFCQRCVSRNNVRKCMLCNSEYFHVQAIYL